MRTMSSHMILPLYAVPAIPCYVLPQGTHLSHSKPLFCGTAIGSAMRSMSSHVVMACTIGSRSTSVRSLSWYLLSPTTPNSLTLHLPPSRGIPTSRNSNTGLCTQCPLTRYCLYMQYPLSHATFSRGTHFSHSTPLFCGTAIGFAMRSISSHVVTPLQ